VDSFADSVELSIAVSNIFDEDPPYGQGSFAAIGLQDLIGRYVSANLKIQF
jgi:outer membrane receptor protein involved in Fe transport